MLVYGKAVADMSSKISMTLNDEYQSMILDKGVVLNAWKMRPARSVFNTHLAQAPIPFVDNENLAK